MLKDDLISRSRDIQCTKKHMKYPIKNSVELNAFLEEVLPLTLNRAQMNTLQEVFINTRLNFGSM